MGGVCTQLVFACHDLSDYHIVPCFALFCVLFAYNAVYLSSYNDLS